MGNNFNNLFKNISQNLYCPSCGIKYTGNEINSVIKSDQGYLVSVNCHKCKLTVMVNVVGNKDIFLPSGITENPIGYDDVIDFHNEVVKFNGNFRKVFHKN
ncbi:MAG: hypothetical protein WCP14_04275 [bacterium]